MALPDYPDPYEPTHGVIEESSPRDDERVFTLKRSNGKWAYIITMPADEVDEKEIELLWRLLRRKERHRLRIV